MGDASSSSETSSLLKFLSSVKGDLANVTIPPFFLAPKSVTEVPASWAERPSSFAAPAKESDPQRRALLVLKFFLSSLRTQFYVGGDVKGGIKKPLNAFLGEIHAAKYSDGEATTEYISEQVSHHPPITAVHMWDEKNGIIADGYARVEMTFNGNVNIKQYGHAIIHINEFNEDYLMPFPDAQVKGLMSGQFYPELTGTYEIVSTSGFISEIDFSGKGMLSTGTKNSFNATVYKRSDAKKTPLYTAEGQWTEKITIRDSTGREIEIIDTATNPVPPIFSENEDPWETRIAWKDVIACLWKGDSRRAGTGKSKLEEAQREMRKKEKAEHREWEPLFFSAIDEWYPTFDTLAEGTGWSLQKEKTNGVWRYSNEKGGKVQRPFHGDLTPIG